MSNEIKIYQCYFHESQKYALDPAFIPYDGSASDQQEYHEYPHLKALYKKNKNYDGYWGLTSWRWSQKCNITGSAFIRWMNDNPGYDVYHPNIGYGELGFPNIFIQGNQYHGKLLNYMERLCKLLGVSVDLYSRYPTNYFIASHYYVAKNNFWDGWMSFLKHVLEISRNDRELNDYMLSQCIHRDRPVYNFCFAVERLVVLYLILNQNFRVKEFPCHLYLNTSYV